MEVVLASSSADGGISCWDLSTGADLLLHKSCASSPHGLTCVGQRLIASAQLTPSSSSGTVYYWSWDRPQVEVKSFPAEPIGPLMADSQGTYLLGGGVSGEIYMWEVASGRLLKHWRAHIRAVTCIVFSDDDSIIVSGAENGEVRVWSLYSIFADDMTHEATHLYTYDIRAHDGRITDIIIGFGGWNAIFITASTDKLCKVWSLSEGKLLRSILFPSEINAIALDPWEHVFYAGGSDGLIYIAALHANSRSTGPYGNHIIGALHLQSEAITSLAYSTEQNLLISGSKDGTVKACDTNGHNIRIFKHTTGHINNVAVVRKHPLVPGSHLSYKRKLLPPPLEKYANSSDDVRDAKAIVNLQDVPGEAYDVSYISHHVTNQQLRELAQQGSVTAKEAEAERLKLDYEKSIQYNMKWKQSYDNLHGFCINEILDTAPAARANNNMA